MFEAAAWIVISVVALLTVMVFGNKFIRRGVVKLIEKVDTADLANRRRTNFWVLEDVDYKTEQRFLDACHLYDVQFEDAFKRKMRWKP